MKEKKLTVDNFTTVPFTIQNLDRYVVRNSILSALNKSAPRLDGRLLDIGCGSMPYKKYILKKSTVREYIGLDIDNALVYDSGVKPDFRWDGVHMPFGDQEFHCAMGTEMLEHCPEPDLVLKEIHRVLKPGGIFFFTVPFLWPLHEVPHDEYRYTPFSLERHLKGVGFSNVELTALGGWNASLAQMIGLWVRRSPMGSRKRAVASYLLKPIIKILLKRDRKPSNFVESTMITGLSGIAIK